MLILVWGLLSLLALAWLAPAFAHAAEVWGTDEEFGYGYLVTPIALGLLWLRRRTLRQAFAVPRGASPGLLFVSIALVLFLVQRREGMNVLGGLSVPPLLLGMVIFLWGWRAARAIAFPVLFLLFGLALFRGLLGSVGFWMQDVSAVGAEIGAHWANLPVTRDGLILRSNTYAFVVAEACSGMSSLLSLLSLVTLAASFMHGAWWRRGIVIVSVVPAVILANIARITLVLLVADRFGSDTAEGFFHGASSLVLFGLTLGIMVVESQLLRCMPALEHTLGSVGPQDDNNPPDGGWTVLACGPSQRRKVLLSGILVAGLSGAVLLGAAPALNADGDRWPTASTVYEVGGWSVSPEQVDVFNQVHFISRKYANPQGATALLTIKTSSAPKRIYPSGVEVPFLGSGYAVQPAPPDWATPSADRGVWLVQRNGELGILAYAYGERRGLLGNGVRGWSWALFDALAGQPNVYYQLTLFSPQSVSEASEAQPILSLADTVFSQLRTWYMVAPAQPE